MPEQDWIIMSVARDVDVLVSRARARRFADRIGFNDRACSEIAIVVSELATNVVKFAGRGAVTLAEYEEDGKAGIEILTEDRGPGIRDPQAAVIDGYSEGRHLSPDDLPHTRRGMGAGLGAVHRLMDEVRLENRPEGGFRCVAWKWLVGSSTESSRRASSSVSTETSHV